MSQKRTSTSRKKAPKKKAAPVGGMVITRQQLAHLIGATPDRVTRFVSEGLPVLRTGSGRGHQTEFDLRAALPWLLQRRTGKLDEERTRYFQLQADKIAQELRVRAGELVEAGDVESRWAAMVGATRERLLSMPSVLLQRALIAATAEDAVIELMDDALSELSTTRQ